MRPESEPDGWEPRLARRSPFAPATKLCPNCLSPLQNATGTFGGWLTPMDYHCSKCGYIGKIFVEKEPEPSQGKG